MEVFQSLVPLLQDNQLRAVHGLYHPNSHFPFRPGLENVWQRRCASSIQFDGSAVFA